MVFTCRVTAGIRHMSCVTGATSCADGGTTSEASSQDAFHLLRCHCESLCGSESSRYHVSWFPLKNWSVPVICRCHHHHL